MDVTKPIDIGLLSKELALAGQPADNGLFYAPTGNGEGILFAFDDAGQTTELPPEAEPVVDAHVAPPRVTEYAGAVDVSAVARTTDATPLAIYRLTLEQKHGYRADCTLTAIDSGNGALRSWEARFVFKRLTAGAVRVGVAMVSDIMDSQASSWTVTATPSGNDMVVTIAGAAGRTIDWLLVGIVGRYAPAGLTS